LFTLGTLELGEMGQNPDHLGIQPSLQVNFNYHPAWLGQGGCIHLRRKAGNTV